MQFESDEEHLNAIVRYRQQLPIPRYWLRSTAFIFILCSMTIASGTGAIPSLFGSWDNLSARVSSFAQDDPDPVLMHMVSEGLIRPARQADIDAWIAVARLTEEERRNLSLYPRRTFVVLDQITLPGGMFGADSRSFIIPSGVPMPRSGKSHNDYYLMERGTCMGGIC